MNRTLKERIARILPYSDGEAKHHAEYAERDDLIVLCKGEPDTDSFGIRLSDVLEQGDILALTGDLGAGKTTLTKAIATGLGVTETVTSPTFTIVKEYRSGRLPLYHFDVYRFGELPDPAFAEDAFYDIGGEEYLYGDGVCVIEWADIVKDALPEETIWINVEYGSDMSERIYRIRIQ